MEATAQAAASFPSPRRLSYFARFLAVYTLLLIVAGALVTSNNASLADATWPTFAGNILPKAETFVRGLVYEDSHRIKAALFGVFMIILALWVTFAERRLWVKALAWGLLGATIAQGIVGGVIIHYLRPVPISMLHGFIGQSIFVGMAVLAAATTPEWNRRLGAASGQPGGALLKFQCSAATALVFFQLILGTATRFGLQHFNYAIVLHVVGAFAVAIAALWVWLYISQKHPGLGDLRRPANLILGLIAVQFMLGIFAIFANRTRHALEQKGPIPEAQFGLELEMPPLWMALISTAHVATGAIILVTFSMLTLRAYLLFAPRPSAPVEAPAHAVGAGSPA